MSKNQPGILFDATNSWNGYNHQGKLAIWFAMKRILELFDPLKSQNQNREMLEDHFIELEYLEDFSIGRLDINGNAEYLYVHQVKDLESTSPSTYRSALIGLADHIINYPSVISSYLHTTVDVHFPGSFESYLQNELKTMPSLQERLIKNIYRSKDTEPDACAVDAS